MNFQNIIPYDTIVKYSFKNRKARKGVIKY